MGGLLFFIYIIKAILNFIIQYWGHIVGVRIQGDMRKEMFEHLQNFPLPISMIIKRAQLCQD